jgi:ankyrin repeat protein
MKILVPLISAYCLLMLSACLQGLEGHSRFDVKPPIMRQAMAGNLQAVQKYVESGGDINVTDKMGNTLLMMASNDDHVELVEYLLGNGADPKRRNVVGESTLNIGRRGQPKRVTKVLEAVD